MAVARSRGQTVPRERTPANPHIRNRRADRAYCQPLLRFRWSVWGKMNPLRIESAPFSWIGRNPAVQDAPAATGVHLCRNAPGGAGALFIIGPAAGKAPRHGKIARSAVPTPFILGLF